MTFMLLYIITIIIEHNHCYYITWLHLLYSSVPPWFVVFYLVLHLMKSVANKQYLPCICLSVWTQYTTSGLGNDFVRFTNRIVVLTFFLLRYKYLVASVDRSKVVSRDISKCHFMSSSFHRNIPRTKAF